MRCFVLNTLLTLLSVVAAPKCGLSHRKQHLSHKKDRRQRLSRVTLNEFMVKNST